MSKRKWTDKQLIEAVKQSKSVASVIKQLKLKPAGGNYMTINNKIKELDLDTSHFTGQGWNRGLQFVPKQAKPLNEILVKDCNYQSYKLAKRLIKEGIKENKCECCGLTNWLQKPIKLELHHINGIHNDNRLENLQLLCPNCHSYTDNYRGKNIKSATVGNSVVEEG